MDKIRDGSIVFKIPISTPPPFNKVLKSIVPNKDIMMGYISDNGLLPSYEDLIPFNYNLYKLIKTNKISLSTFTGIENIDWYNLNLLSYVACNKKDF